MRILRGITDSYLRPRPLAHLRPYTKEKTWLDDRKEVLAIAPFPLILAHFVALSRSSTSSITSPHTAATAAESVAMLLV